MTRLGAILLLPFAAVGVSEPVQSAISATELVHACRAFQQEPRSATGVLCQSYLLGFIEGAAAAGELVLESRDGDRDRGFAERAARTRIGSRLRREGLLPDPEFCLPEPAPLVELADHIVRQPVERSPGDERLAVEILRVVLRRHYSCARLKMSPPLTARPEPMMAPSRRPSECARRVADRALARRAA